MAINKLNKDWLTEGHIDFEYKQYLLLAYFKEVSKAFSDVNCPLGVRRIESATD